MPGSTGNSTPRGGSSSVKNATPATASRLPLPIFRSPRQSNPRQLSALIE
jgi:hypothetical protein